jgi:hypothetical protein
MLGLEGKGCNLAVRINGQSYFVDGSDIDSHGDAHADDGFCKKIRKAKVQAELLTTGSRQLIFSFCQRQQKRTADNFTTVYNRAFLQSFKYKTYFVFFGSHGISGIAAGSR